MDREFSSGGIVFKNDQDGVKVLVVKNSKMNNPKVSYWGFPKGHTEQGEDSRQTALREVKEETGIEAKIISKIGESKYVFTRNGKKTFKIVLIFMMEYTQGEIVHQAEEVSEVKWVSPEEAMGILSFKNDKALLQKGLEDYGRR